MSNEKFKRTELWKNTLELRENDSIFDARERLRSAFELFRERAALLASEINRDLPEFTVHDVSHIDALWEMAELITGTAYPITPTEAFVLGGAFLIHDLGMGLAAYPEGIKNLRENPLWTDTKALLLKRRLGRYPSREELSVEDSELNKKIKETTLRNLHARHAERLALVSWKKEGSDQEYFLIDSPELRRSFGEVIGKIAHSHWWSVHEIPDGLPTTIGAPTAFPNGWTVDPTKLACILRVSDAVHLDQRRAPGFLNAVRNPSTFADEHWRFQEALTQPQTEADRLIFTSSRSFQPRESGAWWLCYDALTVADNELREVDSLLADTNRPRFRIRGVKGVEKPERLERFIPTEGWEPVDAKVKVSDVTAIVRRLGGEQLYGEDATVPLRELMQNAADAIRARRLIENRPENWGSINVKLGQDKNGIWIRVEDDGVGMSRGVLKGPLLDFGTTFWGSEMMLQEFKGLLSKGFKPTGKFGIGFFSVFMWGQKVRITSRRYDAAHKDTSILEFNDGLSHRPLLRQAKESEYRTDGGTTVQVWLNELEDDKDALEMLTPKRDTTWRLEQICAWLAPAIDVNLHVDGERVVSANDWKTMNGEDLLRRISGKAPEDVEIRNSIMRVADNLDSILDTRGNFIGRAGISTSTSSRFFSPTGIGVVTTDGFRATSLSRIAGVFVGETNVSARNIAVPVVDNEQLSEWASNQERYARTLAESSEELAQFASLLLRFKSISYSLPIALSSKGWMSIEEIEQWRNIPDEILLWHDAAYSLSYEKHKDFALASNVLVVSTGWNGILQTNTLSSIDWPEIGPPMYKRADGWRIHDDVAEGAVINAIAKRWAVSIESVAVCAEPSTDTRITIDIVGFLKDIPITDRVDKIKKP